MTYTKARMNQDSMTQKLTIDQNKLCLKVLGQDVPLGGIPNQPEDVAYSMLFLGSDDAKMMTGEVLVVDGGQSLTSDRFDDFTVQLRKQQQQQ